MSYEKLSILQRMFTKFSKSVFDLAGAEVKLTGGYPGGNQTWLIFLQHEIYFKMLSVTT